MQKANSQQMIPIVFLSLGPGDAELLTVKAAKMLQQADIIIIPATADADGQMHSRAADIVGAWSTQEKIHLYPLPMRPDRQAAHAVYDRIYTDAREAQASGQRVVVAVEGDTSIYASIHYVLERLRADGIATEQQPGIPSFIAAAAMAGLSLCSQQERLLVIPGDATAGELRDLLDSGHVVVVMKLSRCQQAVKQLLCEQGAAVEVNYFENVGTPAAFHTADADLILHRDMPYFSLAIIRRGTDRG